MNKFLKNIGATIKKENDSIQITFTNDSFYRIDKNNVTRFNPENEDEYDNVLVISHARFYDLEWLIERDNHDRLAVEAYDSKGNEIEEYGYYVMIEHFEQEVENKELETYTSIMLDYCEIISFVKNEIIKLNPKIKKEVNY